MNYDYDDNRVPDREPAESVIQIRDRYLDLPKRMTIIKEDDITNLKIALGTATSIDDLIEMI